MNKAKKIITGILIASMAAVPVACGGGNSGEGGDATYAVHRDEANATVKRGVCVSRYNYGNGDGEPNNVGGKVQNKYLTLEQSADRIEALDCGWYYTWGAQSNNTYVDESVEFVPMVWGGGDAANVATRQSIKDGYESGKYTHLLTFNEPDLVDQSHLSVDAALAYWDVLEEIGIPLSAPAVSYYDKDNGNWWLDDFMKKATAQKKRVDFIAIHIYQTFYNANEVTKLKDTLTALYDKYGLPVWLTEFAAVDVTSRDIQQIPAGSGLKGTVNPACTEANSIKYMTQATNMLEQLGFVERYAWFLDNFGGCYDDDNTTTNDRPWEAPFTALYNDDDSLSGMGAAYKAVESNFPLTLETLSLANAKRNTSYSQTVSVCGGTGNYTFKASGLPKGLKMSGAGVITGTPADAGTYPVKITVTDSGKTGRRQSFTHQYAFTIER